MKGWKAFRAWLTRLNEVNGRDWKVFFLSLLLAFCVWLIHNLSLNYSDYVDVPVVAASELEGRTPESSNSVTVHAQCRMTGYSLIGMRLRHNRPRHIHVEAGMLKPYGGDVWYMTSKDLQEFKPVVFGETAKVENIFTDTLFFHFPGRTCKKVPVTFIGDISCADQYTVSELRVSPDSVVVYGEPYHLEKISTVNTRPVVKVDLDKDAKGMVKLRADKDVTLSSGVVSWTAEVTRYVEVSGPFTVKVLNVPADKDVVVIPSEVKVSFTCPFPMVSDPLETASFYVDYADFEKSYDGKCIVRAEQEVPGIIRWSASPQMVECLVKTKD